MLNELIMSQDMNLSVNGQSKVPPGFRFHPTEEELLHYYLRKKVAYEKIDLDVIRDVDLNKLEPWDIQERCKIGSTPQNDWYFFSHKDKKYPTGTRTNRATAAGFWKATGRDKVIYGSCRRIGMRKTLVFYRGRAPHGQKSDWIMHEYRLEEGETMATDTVGESTSEEGWVVCRVFRKKNFHKSSDSPRISSAITADSRMQMLNSSNQGVLDQILLYMGRTCKHENEQTSSIINNCNSNKNNNNTRFPMPPIIFNEETFEGPNEKSFIHLPRLGSPTLNSPFNFQNCYSAVDDKTLTESELSSTSKQSEHNDKGELSDWVTLDRLVASQLNGHQIDPSKQFSSLGDPSMGFCFPYDNDLWSFARTSASSSSLDPLCNFSV